MQSSGIIKVFDTEILCLNLKNCLLSPQVYTDADCT